MIARGCVELSKIESQWDEMMRMAAHLKLGTIHASELIRSLLRSSRPSVWLRRLWKWAGQQDVVSFLNIDDEDYRRRILTSSTGADAMQWLEPFATNVVRLENATEGQKINWCSGLVTNACRAVNTLYMQEALSHLRNWGKTPGRGASGKIIAADTWPYKYAGTLYVFVTGRYSEGRVKTIKFEYKQ
jgi:TnpA family transposase